MDGKRHRLRLSATKTDCGIECGRFYPDSLGGNVGTATSAAGAVLLVTRVVFGITCKACERAQR